MAERGDRHDELVGVTIGGRYWIIARLGAGGMGVAYRAWDELGHEPVVIKIPQRAFLTRPDFVERFYREIRLLQGLVHPHVVPIIDVGEHDGMPFIVLRFLPGGSLFNRRLRDEQGKPMPNPAGMLHLWLPAIAAALDHMHAQGVVHRDVKPGNIFFDAFWHAYLGDFGIAKIVEESTAFDREQTLTGTNMGIGTPDYMSPEQFTPKAKIDGRADQYALAVTVYDMLAGHKPFMGKKAHLIVEVTTHPPLPLQAKRPDLPESLVAAVYKGLAKKPADRFGTCEAFAAAVLRDVPLLEDEPGVARLLCLHCPNLLKLPVAAAGKKGRCPRCRAKMKVAEDLKTLWMLDEIAPHEQPHPEAAVIAAALGEEVVPDEYGNEDDELGDFKPVSSATPIGRSTRRQWQISPFAVLLCAAAIAVLGVSLREWKSREGGRKPRPSDSAAHEEGVDPSDQNAGDTSDAGQSPADDELSVPVSELATQPGANNEPSATDAAAAIPAVQPHDLIQLDLANALSSYDRPRLSDTFSVPVEWLAVAAPTNASDDDPFRSRRTASRIAAAAGGGADTEQAVDRALKWLALHQSRDGGWTFDLNAAPNCMGQCTHSGEAHKADRYAATALAVLPFLGRGYTHREGPYKQQLEKAIGFLRKRAADSRGKLYESKGSLYSQGIATLALAECAAMTGDKRFEAPTQLALNVIMEAQDPRGGGWRYAPKQPGDISVSGWQVQALLAGRRADLQVNPLVIKKAVDFLGSVQSDDGAAYGYTDPGDAPATTAVGLLCRIVLGWKKDHPALQRGVAAIAKLGPSDDLYYDYYATQIMHHFEGDMWIAWNNKMKKALLRHQAREGHAAGSFYEGVAGGIGADAAGRLYCTSLATLILEVYYRYPPIYRATAADEPFKE